MLLYARVPLPTVGTVWFEFGCRTESVEIAPFPKQKPMIDRSIICLDKTGVVIGLDGLNLR